MDTSVREYLQQNQSWNIIASVRVLRLRTISDIEELNYVVRIIEVTKEKQARNFVMSKKACSK